MENNEVLIEPDFAGAEEYCSLLPQWARKENSTAPERFAYIFGVLEHFRPQSMVEIGVSSGTLSGALLFKSRQYSDTARLCAIDFGERVYYDQTRRIGDALREAFPELVASYDLHTGVTALEVDRFAERKFDFAYIDANHSHPWAAIDCLCLLPHLAESAVIGFHDTASGHSLARSGAYTFRALDLEKTVDGGLDPYGSGFCVFKGDVDGLLESLLDAFSLPWQTRRDNGGRIVFDHALTEQLADFVGRHFGDNWRTRFARCFKRAEKLGPIASELEESRERRLLADVHGSLGWRMAKPFRWLSKKIG